MTSGIGAQIKTPSKTPAITPKRAVTAGGAANRTKKLVNASFTKHTAGSRQRAEQASALRR